ncbi:MAG: undecaprenyl/decaprenyl-phosphate alpha-N-acetylglucosaminyl 1-phosphate transferase [Gemmatimonadaceae bacterium]|nr:undecaprenyl/decaprenyl-phosphate alpha-N-acetylglucosaminyl 1-phosphate transferase [Gemmatimonadaceae bacterium]
MIRTATNRGFLDVPDRDRRIHQNPVPRLGGVAVFLSAGIALASTLARESLVGTIAIPFGSMLPGLLLGCTIVFITGLVDDIRGVPPRFKLLAQTAAALTVVSYGFSPHTASLAPGGTTLDVGTAFGTGIAVLWIVGVTNAFNLIDGVDGLAGSFALIGLSACVVTELLLHDQVALTLTVALLGAVFAFLRFNQNPARIFLGDSGSMTLGFFLAVSLVSASTDAGGVTYPLVPLFALAFPLADTFIAIARRWLRGHPFSRADGRHIHHQLLALGLSPRRTVELLGLIFASVAAVGIAISFAPPRLTVALAIAGGVGMFAIGLYGLRWLQYSEFVEFGASMASVIRNARTVVQEKVRAQEIAAKIRAASSLDELRLLLAELVSDTRLLDIELVELSEGLHSHGPPSQQLSRYDALPLRLDYPFAWQTTSGMRELVLRVWCARPGPHGHATAERLAVRIGPAIERWFAQHGSGAIAEPDSLTPVRGVRKVKSISGPHRQL